MNKILELYFNNYKKDEIVFCENFCFTASRKKENARGGLYLAGEIRHLRGKCQKFLAILAEIIQKEYYQSDFEKPSDCLKSSLQKANLWLSNVLKKEGVNLQGNLGFNVLALTANKELIFAKLGNLKTILSRDEEIFNLGDKIVQGGAKFSNIIEGTLLAGDKIFIFSKDVFLLLEKERLLKRLAQAKKIKEIKKIFSGIKKQLKQFSGLGLIIFVKNQKMHLPSLLSLKISEKNLAFRFLEKILPQSPRSKSIVKKILICLLVLAILLPLGWLLFR